jgi:molecular chaperone HscC
MALIGIDLGTTNSLVARWTEAGPELIRNALGEVLTPSVVGLDDDGSVLVGTPARERLLTHPDLTIADFKRTMGSAREVRLGRRSFRPEELSAFVLRALRQDAEAQVGGPIGEAVISVPAYFNDLQRKATLDAGRLAGLAVERLVNEPTAAALAYGLGEVEEGKFLVFDLGGGTFDVSILDKYENVLEVRASAGDTRLGGNDFRAVILSLVCRASGIDWDRLAPGDKNRLLRLAERLKVALSSEPRVEFAFALGGAEHQGAIARDEFESEADGLLRRLRQPLELAISDATLQPAELDNVILVGGATRMPMVRRLVGRLFGRLPLSHLDPDTIVGLGAAVQAGLKARHHALEDVVMTDVCPFTLGIATLENPRLPAHEQQDVMSPLIERNAVVPVSRTGRYYTVNDNQTHILVEVYQGENLRPQNNVRLGDIRIEVPRAKAGEQGIDVCFTYDINGALEVEVASVATGRRERRVFRNQANLSEAELEQRFRALEGIKLHPRDRVENRALLARAERIWSESVGERRELVRDLMRQFEALIGSQRDRHAERHREEFARRLDELEHSIFNSD